ncbi:helix-turn-helix domain-containing protein [Bacillus sp. LL01]|uniref:helix-turn-helix domain-containing protein n=1 Tax=Bacillus sp. LL01 TaxID=1665556 RepID=UPI000AE90031|nr:helix-turn-helix domain-containing protein [Bacillus sp. LL01]
MTALLEEVEKELAELGASINASDKAKYFKQLSKLIELAEVEKTRIYLELNQNERDETFKSFQQQYSIPEHLTVHEVAEILDVSQQMVRRYCAEGKLQSTQRFKNSGKWLISSKQFMEHSNWHKFIQKRAKIKDNSLKLSQKMLDIVGDDDIQ